MHVFTAFGVDEKISKTEWNSIAGYFLKVPPCIEGHAHDDQEFFDLLSSLFNQNQQPSSMDRWITRSIRCLWKE